MNGGHDQGGWATGGGPGGPPPAGYPGGYPPGGYPPGGYPPGGYGAPGWGRPMLPPDLNAEAENGGRARVGLWVGLAGLVVSVVCSIIVFASLSDFYRELFEDAAAGRRVSSTPPTATDPVAAVANMVSTLGSLAYLVAGVLFLMWFHRALTNAAALGLRLSHSPGWGVAGFIVPIVNFWFPYQSMRDLFPEGHPSRRLTGRWWASYLGGQLLSSVAVVAALFSPAVAWVLGAVVVALYVVAAITARELIASAGEVHRELGAAAWAAAGWWSGPPAGYAPAAPGGAPAPVVGPAPAPPSAGPGPVTGGWMPPAPEPPPKDPWGRT